MREDTDRMIERLSREAQPVRPLASPFARAGLLLGGVLGAMAVLAVLAGQPGTTVSHFGDAWFVTELFGALSAGIGAVVAAVVLSVPGRSSNWMWLPVPGLLLWLVGGGLGCATEIERGYVAASLFQSRACFIFILSAGLPAGVAIYLFLRRTLSVETMRVLTLAGLGAALLAATLLQFVHVHGTDPVDFATHVVAVALVTLVGAVAARVRG